jgi:hypothetical protein
MMTSYLFDTYSYTVVFVYSVCRYISRYMCNTDTYRSSYQDKPDSIHIDAIRYDKEPRYRSGSEHDTDRAAINEKNTRYISAAITDPIRDRDTIHIRAPIHIGPRHDPTFSDLRSDPPIHIRTVNLSIHIVPFRTDESS